MNSFKLVYLMDPETTNNVEFVEWGNTDTLDARFQGVWEALKNFMQNPDVQQTFKNDLTSGVGQELFWATALEAQQKEDELEEKYNDIYKLKLDSYLQSGLPKPVAEKKAADEAKLAVVSDAQYLFAAAKTWVVDNNFAQMWRAKWTPQVMESAIWNWTADILVPWAERSEGESTVEIWADKAESPS